MAPVVQMPFVLTHFRFSYIGVFVPHVWIFCLTHRQGVEYFGAPLMAVLYAALSLCMIAAMAWAWVWARKDKHSSSLRLDAVMVCVSIAATVLLAMPLSFSQAWMIYAAAAAAGAGVTWMYLSWAPFFAKLVVRDAVAAIFVAMAVGSALKAIIDLMPPLPATLCLAALPVASLALSRCAQAKQLPAQGEVPIYYEGRVSSVPWRVLVGVAVYSLIVGSMQGMPVVPGGISAEILTLLHHGAEVVVAAGVLWWVFGLGGLIRFSSLWRAVIFFTATALLFLPLINPAWTGGVMVLVSIAQTLVVMLFWVMLADIARHSSLDSVAVFGAGWVAYALPFAAGWALGGEASAHGAGSYALAIMAYLLTLVAVFALNENDIAQRRIFADLEALAPARSRYEEIEARCKVLGEAGGLTAREIEVMELLCQGRSKAYIAESLFISENTVRSHGKHIYQKLGIHSKQELIDLAVGAKKS